VKSVVGLCRTDESSDGRDGGEVRTGSRTSKAVAGGVRRPSTSRAVAAAVPTWAWRCSTGGGLSAVYVTVVVADAWWCGGTDRGHVEDRVRTTAKIMVSAVAAAAAVVVVKEETE